MRRPSFRDHLRYRFDNFMARGTSALVGALLLVTAVIVVAVALLVTVTKAAPPDDQNVRPGFASEVWSSAMHAMDAGALGGDNGDAPYLFFMLLATIGGIFFVSVLIGILNSGLEAKLEQLRKGKSRVIEQGHTLILGWSSQIHTIAAELALAAENHGGTTIVIVADRDKVEMDDELGVKVPDRRGTRIICRSGSPIDLDDLELGSPETAKAIIVLGPDEAADPDASVIKTILALTAHKPRETGKHHIVAEIRDPKNRAPALMVGRDQAQLVVASEVIARIAVQTCRQSGLSGIYNDLLDFGGEEIYFHDAPELAGKKFGDVLREFEDCAVIGLHDAEGTRINPAMDTVLDASATLIVIAPDDDRIARSTSKPPKVNEAALAPRKEHSRVPERTLILGWNARGATIVSELDKYALPGSELLIVAKDDRPAQAIAELEAPLANHKTRTVVGDITDRRLLDTLDLASYEHVITLAYSDELGVQEADAITLVVLLHLRDIETKHGESFSIVSEMLDTKNRRLAEVTQADDFIVSDVLVSLLITQLAENERLAPVFEDLFDADGSEIYLKAATDYVTPDVEVDFYTVLEAARRRGEVAIGYARPGSESSVLSTRINPNKRDKIKLGERDRIVVLADA